MIDMDIKLTETDRRALSFTKDLKDLLKRYDYELSGTGIDDGSMNIETNDGEYYTLYPTLSGDLRLINYDNINLRRLELLTTFPKELKHKPYIEPKNILVYTDNEEKKQSIITNIKSIYNNYITRGDYEIIIPDKDFKYIFVNSTGRLRGQRFKGAYIDDEISNEDFHYRLYPMLIDCTRNDIVFI